MQAKNNFYILNTMIYNVYNDSDFDKMKQNLLLSVRQLISCCCASIFMVNPDNNDELCDPVCNPHSYIQMERRYPNVKDKDFSNWILLKKQSLVIRASDIMPDEERVQTDYYKLAFKPANIHHVIYVTIASHNKLLGMLALYRTETDIDFSEEEVFLLELLSEHLNSRFYAESDPREKNTVTRLSLLSDYSLTMRESEIVLMILEGTENKALCETLSIAENTLKKHLQNIYGKLGIRSKKELLCLLL